MKVTKVIASTIATIALVVTFVGVGFFACIAPPVTHVLANFFSNDALSPFDRTQLVQVADATRDYSFGNHDKGDLFRTIYQVNIQYRQEVIMAGGSMPEMFPSLDVVTDANDVKQLGSAGSADPLDQRASVGWKASHVACRLNEQYMVRIESASSFNEHEGN